MRKVIVHIRMSLDGVAQAPGAPQEDTTGGFAHGGWHLRYFDDTARQWVVDSYAAAGGFLVGATPSRAWRATGRTPPRRSRSVALCRCRIQEPNGLQAGSADQGGELQVPSSNRILASLRFRSKEVHRQRQPAFACYQGDGSACGGARSTR
jgi:hypothetical protein